MLTQGEDVEVHALRRRGWSVSAIARHLGRDRKTVRAYLRGERQPGVRASAALDPLHLIEAIDGVLRRHGGTPRVWRTDRLATVIVPGSRDVQPSFAPVAKYYGAIIEPCPPRRRNRKGAVEA